MDKCTLDGHYETLGNFLFSYALEHKALIYQGLVKVECSYDLNYILNLKRQCPKF